MGDRPSSFTGQMPSSFDENEDFYNERPMQKVTRKIKEEPLIPLGIGLTVFAFTNAYRAIRRGDSRQANRMFRARIAAQGFTVIAMVAGSMYYSKDREKTKELRQLKEQREAEEKRQKWIRELEVRDDEDKAMKAHLQQLKQTAQADADAASASSESNGNKSEGTGGIISRMGLWSKSDAEKAKEEAQAQAESTATTITEKKSARRDNPKSSLSTLGEIMSSNKNTSGNAKTTEDPTSPEKRK